jgi:hypothetical protein
MTGNKEVWENIKNNPASGGAAQMITGQIGYIQNLLQTMSVNANMSTEEAMDFATDQMGLQKKKKKKT